MHEIAKKCRYLAALRVAAVLSVAAIPHAASGTPISASFAYQFLDNVSANSVGINAGARQQLGANCVVPVGVPCFPQAAGAPFGTTGQAFHLSPPNAPPPVGPLQLNFVASDLTSNHFSLNRAPGQIPDGIWTLRFSNGPDRAEVQTPALLGPTVISFANNMAMSGGAAPTFSWSLPAGEPIDAVAINIRDLADVRPPNNGVATIIFRAALSPSTTSLMVAPGDSRFFGGHTALLPNHPYSLEIQLQDTRNNLSGGGFANVANQSRSFFDFELLPPNAPAGKVFLPMIDTSGPVPVHRFQPITVSAGELIFIDPLVAVGYDYQVGEGNPNFRSVLLPTGIGDNLFDLWLWNGVDWFDTGTDLAGGAEFFFGLSGVDRFRITGIELDEAIDPFSATAFITGVSFVSDGVFSGTMTPLVVNIAQVPEASTLALLAAALSVAGWGRRTRRQRRANCR